MSERLRALRAKAEAIGELMETHFRLSEDTEPYEIARPADLDILLDVVASDPEQQLPYWAEFWPSGVALAKAITAAPEIVRGKRVLELGSGLGVTAIAALRAGADLAVADYAPESLVLCRYNALRNAGREPATLRLNWRRPEHRLFDLSGPGFPVVLAADVLYEGRDIAPLLALLDRVVAPNGLLWLAEPGRPPAACFLTDARSTGWSGDSVTYGGPWPDPKDTGVIVGVHRLRRERGR